jgi:hypothetical protein
MYGSFLLHFMVFQMFCLEGLMGRSILTISSCMDRTFSRVFDGWSELSAAFTGGFVFRGTIGATGKNAIEIWL